MHAHTDRLEFAPPPEPAAVRAFTLAVIAHILLMAALTWGINWKKETESVAAEAELWSSVPQQAAPPIVQPPPVPKVVPTPEPKVEPPPPVNRDAEIAVEREKRRKELERLKVEEVEKLKKLEARKEREKLEREKKLEAKRQQEELKREKLAEQKAAEDKRRKEEQAKASKQEEKLAQLRKENMARMMKGLEGGTGAPDATGTAARSSGMSDSYAGRIQARVRPHIVFPDEIIGNPVASVEVKMSPDGTITSRRVVKSSGNKAWDEAVLRALDKTEVLPRDVDGRVRTPLVIDFKPR